MSKLDIGAFENVMGFKREENPLSAAMDVASPESEPVIMSEPERGEPDSLANVPNPEYPVPAAKRANGNGNHEYIPSEDEVSTPWPEGTEPRSREPLSILTFDQIAEIPVDDKDRILGDHILDKGYPLVIAGAGGTGKSRLLYQFLAACIAGHEKFLTLEIHPGARTMKWLVLQTENSVRRLKVERERLKNWLNDEGAWAAFNSHVFTLAPIKEGDTWLNLDDESNLVRIREAIELFKPDGIAVDPLGDYSVGDLNKDVDMRATVMALARLSRWKNPKRALIILHHALTGQSGAAKATGYDRGSFARNSKVLFNFARGQINIASMLEDSNEQLAISCGKCSDGREFKAFGVDLNMETLIYEPNPALDVEEWSAEMKGKRTKSDFTPQDVQMLTLPGMDKLALSKAIMDEIGCSKATAYRHILKAKKKKLIKENEGKFFKL